MVNKVKEQIDKIGKIVAAFADLKMKMKNVVVDDDDKVIRIYGEHTIYYLSLERLDELFTEDNQVNIGALAGFVSKIERLENEQE